MTPRVLVAYGSKRGATAEIADAIAAGLRRCGLDAEAMHAGRAPRDLSAYSAVVLGSAVYAKRWRPEARRFLRSHAGELASMPFWVFSSGPVGEDADFTSPWCEPPKVIARAERLGVRGHVVFGGRVPADPANFMERSMVRGTPAEVADLRDWDAIRAWTEDIARALAPATASAA